MKDHLHSRNRFDRRRDRGPRGPIIFASFQIRQQGGNEQEVRHASRVRESGRAIGPERLNRSENPTTLRGDLTGPGPANFIRVEQRNSEDASMSRPPSPAAPTDNRRGTTTIAPPVPKQPGAGGCSPRQRHAELVSALQDRGLRLSELTALIDLRIEMGLAPGVRNAFGEVLT